MITTLAIKKILKKANGDDYIVLEFLENYFKHMEDSRLYMCLKNKIKQKI